MSRPTPRIILWDIETSHNKVAAFQLRDDRGIPHDNILQERRIVCACWKELGKAKVHSVAALHDDRRICDVLFDVMNEADVLVAHYGDKFDVRFVKGRMLRHGIVQPPVTTVDTYKVAKKHFDLNSYRLDYLGAYLGVGRKRNTRAGLWLDVLDGNAQALREMVVYNQGDVELLERVYLKLQPYVAMKPAKTARKVLNG